MLFPIAFALYLSLHRWDVLKHGKPFVGMANYAHVLRDPLFWNALKNSIYYAVVSVPLGTAVALGVAILVHQKLRGVNFFRTLYYLPAISSAVAISMMWTFIYLPERGLLDWGLSVVGLRGAAQTDWLQSSFCIDRAGGTIRRIDQPSAGTATTTVVTIAGSGNGTMTDGNGSTAVFNSLSGIAALNPTSADPTRLALFVTDSNAIRMITVSPGGNPLTKATYNVTTIAGSATSGSADGTGTGSFHTPSGIWAVPASGPAATLVVADKDNTRIRKLTVPSIPHSGGNGNTVSEAIRLVNWDSEKPNSSPAAWIKNLNPASNGSGYSGNLQFYIPSGVSGFSFTAYVETDTDLVNLPGSGSSYVTTLAGDGVAGYFDGPGKLSEFNSPAGIAAIPPALQSAYGTPLRAVVADSSNSRIRGIDLSGNVLTIAGSSSGNTDGTGAAALFRTPTGIAIAQDGSIIVTDPGGTSPNGSFNVRRITPAGVVTTIAGPTGNGATGTADGFGNVATFTSPQDVTVDSGGTIYVVDGTRVRKIQQVGADPSLSTSYKVTTVYTGLGGGYGIKADTDGRLYVADRTNHTIVTLTRSGVDTMTAATLAGLSGTSGSADGTGTGATFYQPQGIALDSAHNVYVADTWNHRIRRISPQGVVVTIAGASYGFVNGISGAGLTTGTFNSPRNIAVEQSGNLLFTDPGNSAVRATQRIVSDAQAPAQ